MVTIQRNPIEFQVKTASTNESFQIQLVVDRVESYPIAYFFITLGHWTSANQILGPYQRQTWSEWKIQHTKKRF